MLNGTNFKDWKENMMILLGCMDIDLALRMPKPDELNEQSTQEDEVYWGKWERSNRLSLMIMKRHSRSFQGCEEERLKQDKTESAHLASTSKDKGKRKNKDNKVAASNGPEQKKQKVEKGLPELRKPSDAERCIYVGDGQSVEERNIFEDVEFGEKSGSTIAIDNVVSLPIIDQEVNLDPQPTDNIVQPLIANEDIASRTNSTTSRKYAIKEIH
ncbi:hypothetical protein AAG906_033346 [Vitis piasezkii]